MLAGKKISWGVLALLIGLAVLSTLWSLGKTGDLAGAALDFGIEMAGAVVTFWLLTIFLAKQENKEDLITRMGSGARDTAASAAEALMRNGWLRDGSLKGANLVGANLQGAYLAGANLQGARLTDANLQGAKLWDANLAGASLRYADLENAELHEANLEVADLWRANLGGAKLRDAVLRYANLERTTYNTATAWPAGFDPDPVGAILVDAEGNPVARKTKKKQAK